MNTLPKKLVRRVTRYVSEGPNKEELLKLAKEIIETGSGKPLKMNVKVVTEQWFLASDRYDYSENKFYTTDSGDIFYDPDHWVIGIAKEKIASPDFVLITQSRQRIIYNPQTQRGVFEKTVEEYQ